MLLEDLDYQEIREKLNHPNIFISLNNASYEIRHSNFIAWLLNPDETHGQNDYFLRKFFLAIDEPPPDNNEDFKVEREKWKIDILITSKNRVLAIENKIFAKDTAGQLQRYREKIEKESINKSIRLFYWTLRGQSPLDHKEVNHWERFSHEKFNLILKSSKEDLKDHRVSTYVDDYIDALSLKFLRNSQYCEIAKTVVNRYKKDLTDIFKNSKNYAFKDAITIEFLKENSGYVLGKGFFSNEKPFRRAFKFACQENKFIDFPAGKNQSTYFKFNPENIFNYLDNKSIFFLFEFRFFEIRNCITLSFNITKETTANKELRCNFLNNIERIRRLPGVEIVKSRGKFDLGIVKKNIKFNPIEIELSNIDLTVNRIFEKEVSSFVLTITDAIIRILGLKSIY